MTWPGAYWAKLNSFLCIRVSSCRFCHSWIYTLKVNLIPVDFDRIKRVLKSTGKLRYLTGNFCGKIYYIRSFDVENWQIGIRDFWLCISHPFASLEVPYTLVHDKSFSAHWSLYFWSKFEEILAWAKLYDYLWPLSFTSAIFCGLNSPRLIRSMRWSCSCRSSESSGIWSETIKYWKIFPPNNSKSPNTYPTSR